ncbi:MAG: WGR domain-containing protein [Armatimonadetes bacterium]|nr:WGR domain-containing protein [Armatimonadota bacterium]
MMTTTTATTKEARYVLTNIENNNNKFWNIRLFADGSCETHWGRVGEDGQRKNAPSYSEAQFDTKCREKEAKGYRLQKTLANTGGSGKAAEGSRLATVAADQIVCDSPETTTLVKYLARVNVHRILESTTLAYDETRGTFSTPLGIVTADALVEARDLLTAIADLVAAGDFAPGTFAAPLNDYLMLVPQNIGRAKPDPQVLFPDLEAVRKQNGILDSLQASLDLVLNAPENAGEARKAVVPKLFEAKLTLVEDVFEIERIRRKYRETRQTGHACQHLDVKRVFRVDIPAMTQAYNERGAKLSGVQELWHGTRAGNLLSILKGGFMIPPSNAPHCTGRLFGNGVYFANSSTKSLNYAYGYWGGGARDDNCFMFLADVAMGKHYVPTYGEKLPKAGFDSTWAQKAKSGVQNDELIVYRTEQVCPRFLIEFAPTGK